MTLLPLFAGLGSGIFECKSLRIQMCTLDPFKGFRHAMKPDCPKTPYDRNHEPLNLFRDDKVCIVYKIF